MLMHEQGFGKTFRLSSFSVDLIKGAQNFLPQVGKDSTSKMISGFKEQPKKDRTERMGEPTATSELWSLRNLAWYWPVGLIWHQTFLRAS